RVPLRGFVAALDLLRELDLLRGREQVDLADVLQEHLERVGRELELDRLLLGRRELVVEARAAVRCVLLVERRDVHVRLVRVQRYVVLHDQALYPGRMRNSRTGVGRTHGPSGSFSGRPGPSLLDPGEEPFRGEAELRLR